MRVGHRCVPHSAASLPVIPPAPRRPGAGEDPGAAIYIDPAVVGYVSRQRMYRRRRLVDLLSSCSLPVALHEDHELHIGDVRSNRTIASTRIFEPLTGTSPPHR